MFFGHEDKIRTFENLAARGTLGQSYLFFGDKGVGKATFAKLLGYFLEYGAFVASEKTLIDMRFFGPGENRSIGIEEALNVRHFLWQTPLHSSRRFAIVDDAETMTDQAQSALLKIVEEPPAKALLIFVTYDAEALFPPLLSRLIKVYFPRFSTSELRGILTKHYKISSEEARRASGDAFGSLGRALDEIQGKKEVGEDDLEQEIENEILLLRQKGLERNAPKISVLLQKLTLLRRYNLNQNLARKALSYELSKIQ